MRRLRREIVNAEVKVAGHYGKGGLEERIFAALKREGMDLEHLTVEDLAPVDEFHIGQLEATKELAAQMELRRGMHLLDVGSGIGGPARYFAAQQGCQVTGIDLTEEFVTVANKLTTMLKLERAASFRQASALKMPFEEQSFDGAYMMHVGMNIGDKAGVFREVRRVLKKRALFSVYDVMRSGEGTFGYPVPWAQSEETSFVADAATYRGTLQEAGFRVEKERGRRRFAIEFTQRAMASPAERGSPVLGLHLLVGERAPEMLKTMMAAMQGGVLEPVEMIARAE
jgi:ubiquinone/menaquinone biosynthesis C-methylase UbiE